jgi:hypothetical protein
MEALDHPSRRLDQRAQQQARPPAEAIAQAATCWVRKELDERPGSDQLTAERRDLGHVVCAVDAGGERGVALRADALRGLHPEHRQHQQHQRARRLGILLRLRRVLPRRHGCWPRLCAAPAWAW